MQSDDYEAARAGPRRADHLRWAPDQAPAVGRAPPALDPSVAELARPRWDARRPRCPACACSARADDDPTRPSPAAGTANSRATFAGRRRDRAHPRGRPERLLERGPLRDLRVVGRADQRAVQHAGGAEQRRGEPSARPAPSAAPSTAATSRDDRFAAIDLSTPPPRPAALDEPASKEGAGQVATYFLQLVSYAAATHDVTAFEDLSDPECGFCSEALEVFRGYERDGIRTEGGAIVVEPVDVEQRVGSYFTVTVTYSQDASREIAPDGTLVQDDPGVTSSVSELDLLRMDGTWQVVDVFRAAGLRRLPVSGTVCR